MFSAPSTAMQFITMSIDNRCRQILYGHSAKHLSEEQLTQALINMFDQHDQYPIPSNWETLWSFLFQLKSSDLFKILFEKCLIWLNTHPGHIECVFDGLVTSHRSIPMGQREYARFSSIAFQFYQILPEDIRGSNRIDYTFNLAEQLVVFHNSYLPYWLEGVMRYEQKIEKPTVNTSELVQKYKKALNRIIKNFDDVKTFIRVADLQTFNKVKQFLISLNKCIGFFSDQVLTTTSFLNFMYQVIINSLEAVDAFADLENFQQCYIFCSSKEQENLLSIALIDSYITHQNDHVSPIELYNNLCDSLKDRNNITKGITIAIMRLTEDRDAEIMFDDGNDEFLLYPYLCSLNDYVEGRVAQPLTINIPSEPAIKKKRKIDDLDEEKQLKKRKCFISDDLVIKQINTLTNALKIADKQDINLLLKLINDSYLSLGAEICQNVTNTEFLLRTAAALIDELGFTHEWILQLIEQVGQISSTPAQAPVLLSKTENYLSILDKLVKAHECSNHDGNNIQVIIEKLRYWLQHFSTEVIESSGFASVFSTCIRKIIHLFADTLKQKDLFELCQFSIDISETRRDRLFGEISLFYLHFLNQNFVEANQILGNIKSTLSELPKNDPSIISKITSIVAHAKTFAHTELQHHLLGTLVWLSGKIMDDVDDQNKQRIIAAIDHHKRQLLAITDVKQEEKSLVTSLRQLSEGLSRNKQLLGVVDVNEHLSNFLRQSCQRWFPSNNEYCSNFLLHLAGLVSNNEHLSMLLVILASEQPVESKNEIKFLLPMSFFGKTKTVELKDEILHQTSIRFDTQDRPVFLFPKMVPVINKLMFDANVPADGHCLFYSVILGYLIPALSSKELFMQRAESLNEGVITPQDLLNFWEYLTKNYMASDNIFKFEAAMNCFNHLVKNLRLKTVAHIKGTDYPLYLKNYMRYLDPFVDDKAEPDKRIQKRFDDHLHHIAHSNGWGLNFEIGALCKVLGVNIHTYQFVDDDPLAMCLSDTGSNQLVSSEINTIYIINASTQQRYDYRNDKGKDIHYRVLIDPAHLLAATQVNGFNETCQDKLQWINEYLTKFQEEKANKIAESKRKLTSVL